MPTGISQNLLSIARRERKASLAGLAVAALFAVFAGFLAELADVGPMGEVVTTYLAAGLVGLAAGFGFAVFRFRAYENSLRSNWRRWMSIAPTSARLTDVARRASDSEPRSPVLVGTGLAVLATLNVALFALLWIESASGPRLAPAIVAIDGLAIGIYVAEAIFTARWCGRFLRAADELVSDGTVALWGER